MFYNFNKCIIKTTVIKYLNKTPVKNQFINSVLFTFEDEYVKLKYDYKIKSCLVNNNVFVWLTTNIVTPLQFCLNKSKYL